MAQVTCWKLYKFYGPRRFIDKLKALTTITQDTDSKVATQYHSASTKTMCMLNGRIDPALLSEVVEKSVP